MALQDPIYTERRTTLANGLRQVGDGKFFLGAWSSYNFGDTVEKHTCRVANQNDCGTTACVAGWCPVIFPDDWTYKYDVPILRSNGRCAVDAFAEYFGLTDGEARKSTMPTQNPFGLFATAKQCADLVESFNVVE